MDWIPVTERLPDFNTNVLVSYNNGTVSLAQFIAAFSTGYWFNYDNACGSRKVIAWAPLPAPYVNEEPPTDGCFGCKHRIIRSVPTSKFYCDLDDAFHDNLTNCPLEQDAPSASELRG